jgi:hypothetical protein
MRGPRIGFASPKHQQYRVSCGRAHYHTALFHSVFHSCGNLGGETEGFEAQPVSSGSNKTRECSTGKSQGPNPKSEIPKSPMNHGAPGSTSFEPGIRDLGFGICSVRLGFRPGPKAGSWRRSVSRNRWRDRRRASVLTSRTPVAGPRPMASGYGCRRRMAVLC